VNPKQLTLKRYALFLARTVLAVFVDIYVLNHDGNLIDAAALAALSALMNTKSSKYEVEDGEVKKKPGLSALPMKKLSHSRHLRQHKTENW